MLFHVFFLLSLNLLNELFRYPGKDGSEVALDGTAHKLFTSQSQIIIGHPLVIYLNRVDS